MEGLKNLVDDATEDDEMRQMAADDLQMASREETEGLQHILSLMLPSDDADTRGCILEVRAGVVPSLELYDSISSKSSFQCKTE
jgi:peptide chain release factor 1